MQDNASSTEHGDLTAAAQDWLSHRAINSAVPLAEAVAELRFRCPNTALSDEALELLVVELALQRGLAICFDRRWARSEWASMRPSTQQPKGQNAWPGSRSSGTHRR